MFVTNWIEMWSLEVIENESTNKILETLYLNSGEYSVGRKGCDYNLNSNRSISRKHAIFYVSKLTTVQDPDCKSQFRIQDSNSTFGTIVNGKKIDEAVELKHEDRIQFGEASSKHVYFLVRYLPWMGVITRVGKGDRLKVVECAKRMGMHIVSTPTEKMTHCIKEAGSVVATVKVLWALAYNAGIVTQAWMEAVISRKKMIDPLPRLEDYLPVEEHMYLPNEARKSLFENIHVLFLATHEVEGMIEVLHGSEYAVHSVKDVKKGTKEMERQIAMYTGKKRILVVPGMDDSTVDGNRLALAIRLGCQEVPGSDLVSCIIYSKLVVEHIDLDTTQRMESNDKSDDSSVDTKLSEGTVLDHNEMAIAWKAKEQKSMQDAQHVESGELNSHPSLESVSDQSIVGNDHAEWMTRPSQIEKQVTKKKKPNVRREERQAPSSPVSRRKLRELTGHIVHEKAIVETCSLVMPILSTINPTGPSKGKTFVKGNENIARAATNLPNFIPYEKTFTATPKASSHYNTLREEQEELQAQELLADRMFQETSVAKRKRMTRKK